MLTFNLTAILHGIFQDVLFCVHLHFSFVPISGCGRMKTVSPSSGLPGLISEFDYGHQIFFYLLLVIGQLDRRLVRPYRMCPLRLATLIDPERDIQMRLHDADVFLNMKPCCREKHFATPVADTMRREGGCQSILPTSPFYHDLATAFTMKTSNIEPELNFARAANARRAMRGRAHTIGSMVSKHISAEIKLGQRRKLLTRSNHCSHDANSIKPQRTLVLQ